MRHYETNNLLAEATNGAGKNLYVEKAYRHPYASLNTKNVV
jgi:hypothetical protein